MKTWCTLSNILPRRRKKAQLKQDRSQVSVINTNKAPQNHFKFNLKENWKNQFNRFLEEKYLNIWISCTLIEGENFRTSNSGAKEISSVTFLGEKNQMKFNK